MARKKKTEANKETTKKKVVEKKVSHTIDDNPRKGEVFYKNYNELTERVLGKVYEIDGVKARLVYVGEKCKFIVE